MLEWLPKHAAHHTPSQRFQEVTHFLEEAAKVVPIESIFYAVAYNNDDIALSAPRPSRPMSAIGKVSLPLK